jgi:hypothetical protein
MPQRQRVNLSKKTPKDRRVFLFSYSKYPPYKSAESLLFAKKRNPHSFSKLLFIITE